MGALTTVTVPRPARAPAIRRAGPRELRLPGWVDELEVAIEASASMAKEKQARAEELLRQLEEAGEELLDPREVEVEDLLLAGVYAREEEGPAIARGREEETSEVRASLVTPAPEEAVAYAVSNWVTRVLRAMGYPRPEHPEGRGWLLLAGLALEAGLALRGMRGIPPRLLEGLEALEGRGGVPSLEGAGPAPSAAEAPRGLAAALVRVYLARVAEEEEIDLLPPARGEELLLEAAWAAALGNSGGGDPLLPLKRAAAKAALEARRAAVLKVGGIPPAYWAAAKQVLEEGVEGEAAIAALRERIRELGLPELETNELRRLLDVAREEWSPPLPLKGDLAAPEEEPPHPSGGVRDLVRVGVKRVGPHARLWARWLALPYRPVGEDGRPLPEEVGRMPNYKQVVSAMCPTMKALAPKKPVGVEGLPLGALATPLRPAEGPRWFGVAPVRAIIGARLLRTKDGGWRSRDLLAHQEVFVRWAGWVARARLRRQPELIEAAALDE